MGAFKVAPPKNTNLNSCYELFVENEEKKDGLDGN